MTLQDLQTLLDNGTFHHATYREIGTLWEGLWIYGKDIRGFRGYSVVGCFGKDHADLAVAHKLVRGTGVSVGAYGRG